MPAHFAFPCIFAGGILIYDKKNWKVRVVLDGYPKDRIFYEGCRHTEF